MLVTNNHKTALALPGGIHLSPGVQTPVHNWERLSALPVVKAWVKAGILSVAATAPPSELLAPDRDAIAARLKELGVSFHPNTGTEKLQAKLAEAEADAAVEAASAAGALEAFTASGKSVEEWNALAVEERQALVAAHAAAKTVELQG